jgi:hypothetical protein
MVYSQSPMRPSSWNGNGPHKAMCLQFVECPLIIYPPYNQIHALDSFISPIPGFEGDILILAILMLARTPSAESAHDLSVGTSAGSSRTRAGKCKATTTLPPSKKAKKVGGQKV